jgi:large repetitive protein
VLVNSEGETLVEFRAVDGAGNPSAWSAVSPAGTIRLDQTGPSDPNVSGGSSSWQDPAFVAITGSGAADPMSGIDHYRYRTSTDGGITWSAAIGGSTATISSEGQTLVQFQAVDAAGNTSNWAPAAPTAGSTVRLDQTPPTDPTVTGGSLAWQSVSSEIISASGSTDLLSGQDHYEYRTSTTGGATWSTPVAGGSALITAEGETVVQFRGVDLAGNASNWAPAVPDVTDTVRIDRTAPGNPVVTGGSAAWQNVAGVTVTGGGASDPLSGVSHYELHTSTDGGVTWSPAATGTTFTANSEGETLVQYRAVDVAGNAAPWWPAAGTGGATARIDRTAPTPPLVSGGDTAWQSVASVTVTANGSTDSPGSGVSSYQYRTSTDGGVTWGPITTGVSVTVTAEGQTVVQFRSVDVAGFTSAWTPSVGTLAGTVRLDRTAPSAPTATGGSLTWQNVAGVTITGGSSVDTGGSALAGYLYRTSTDGGATWSPSSAGSSVAVNAEGQTLVQFAAVDGAGNQSAWAPVNAVAGSTARIDRTPPTDPSAAGGSLSWQSLASVVVTPTGATDSPGSGVASYQYRTSVNGGTTWTAPVSGASVSVSAQGETLVQFRATDAAGFQSNWAPAALTPGATVRLDRTAPSAPAVTGGALTWQNVASLTVTGTGSTDTGGSGLSGYQVRTSSDNGITWSATAAGPSATASTEGQTLAQVRSVDVAGNTSAWTPAVAGVSNTMRIDRTAPSDPTVAGGSASWHNSASVTITGSGSTDSPGSGVASYQYRTSTDGGTTWSGASAGASAVVSAQTTTRLVDLAQCHVGLRHGIGINGLARLGYRPLRVPHIDRRRRHLGRTRHRWHGEHRRRRRDRCPVPGGGRRRLDLELGAGLADSLGDRPSRPHRADRAHVRRWLAQLAERGLSDALGLRAE